MTNKKINLFFLSCLFAVSAQAAFLMKEEAVMDVSISSKGLTRLSVKGNMIQDIFVYPLMVGDVSLSEAVQLHKSGHVFIAPYGLKEPFYVTLITQKGHVQDLKLIPSSSKTQPLVLEMPQSSSEGQTKESGRKMFEGALLAALQGIQPLGFQTKPLTQLSSHSLGSLQMTQKAVYDGREHRITVFELENKSPQDLSLTPEMFLNSEDLAIVFERPFLKEGEKTLMAVLTPLSPPVFLKERPVLTEPLPVLNTPPAQKGKTPLSEQSRPLEGKRTSFRSSLTTP